MSPVKVLVVDDSAILRQTLRRELSKHRDIEVVGTAPDPYVARDMIVEASPDVISLDVEMPRMDGITFLRKLMRHHPLPVVIVSSLTPKGGEMAMEALEAGALAVVCKPRAAHSAEGVMEELAQTLVSVSKVDVKSRRRNSKSASARPASTKALAKTTNLILAMGASTGGTEALLAVLRGMPHNLPGTVIAQHMPEMFTASFARRLAEATGLDVAEARDGESIVPGRVLVAPGNRHLLVRRSGARYLAQVKAGPRVNRHRPSVDVLFNSVAKTAGANALGVMLTGMGSDGAKGMLAMKEAGAATVAQDEASCVVFGMPKAALDLGGVDKVMPLRRIPEHLVGLIKKR